MEELQQAVLDALNSAGGELTWEQYMELVPARMRFRPHDALRDMEAKGQCWRRSRINSDTGRPELHIVAGQKPDTSPPSAG